MIRRIFWLIDAWLFDELVANMNAYIETEGRKWL